MNTAYLFDIKVFFKYFFAAVSGIISLAQMRFCNNSQESDKVKT